MDEEKDESPDLQEGRKRGVESSWFPFGASFLRPCPFLFFFLGGWGTNPFCRFPRGTLQYFPGLKFHFGEAKKKVDYESLMRTHAHTIAGRLPVSLNLFPSDHFLKVEKRPPE